MVMLCEIITSFRSDLLKYYHLKKSTLYGSISHSNKHGRRKDPKLHYNTVEDENEEEEELEGTTLVSQFVAFAKHGNPEDTGTHIALSQIDYWMKQAGIIQVRVLTKTDTGICYFHFKKYKLDFEEFREFIMLLSNRKRIPVEDIIEKLVKCGPPMAEDEMKRR